MLIQIILVSIMALAFIMTWRRFRQRVIPLSEALLWSLLWIVATGIVIAPQISTRIAHFVGVGRGADLVVYAAVPMLFFLVFKLFIKHEELERKLTEIVRHDALRDLDKN
ncbi:MAG: DUF2304 domain-containing protein [Patescibacteria group bacterium]|jgi:hypothetical protein